MRNTILRFVVRGTVAVVRPVILFVVGLGEFLEWAFWPKPGS